MTATINKNHTTKKTVLPFARRPVNVGKRKGSLLCLWIFFVYCLFSQKVYADPLRFIAYGDTRLSIENREKPQEKHNTIATVIQEMSPAFILFSGDMICYDEFEKFLEVVVRNYTPNKIPIYPVIGNHELIFGREVDATINALTTKLTARKKTDMQPSSHPGLLKDIERLSERLYREIYSIADEKLKRRSREVLCEEIMNKLDADYASYLKEVLSGEVSDMRSWYSFTKEVNGLRIKFIAMNSSLPDDDEQYQWFLNELKQFDGPKIIVLHYPPYSIGFHGCDELSDKKSRAARFRDRYLRLFNDTSHNVMMVISGHEHNYQRFFRTDGTGTMQLPVYIISGGGGAPLSGRGLCDISSIPLDGFQCSGLITAYQFVDIAADFDEGKNLALKCRVLGVTYDLTKGLPDDDSFKKQFTRDRLELLDAFTVNWKREQ